MIDDTMDFGPLSHAERNGILFGIEASIDLQRRADELAMRLTGDDRLLVFELRSTIEQQAERLGRIATLAG